MSRAPTVLLAFGLLLPALGGAGCIKSGGEKKAVPEAPRVEPGPETAPPEDSYWRDGRLPPEIAAGTPRRGGQVTVQLFSEPPSLNHLIDPDAWTVRMVHGFVYEPLVAIDPYDDPDYGHVPVLAERWEVSEDGRTYTFHLRRGVRWHDGTPFTAKDVVATFDKIQDPTTKAVHVRAYTEDLERYEALDEHTVRFVWKRPYFLTLDFFADQPILPAHVIAKLSGAEFNEAKTNPLNRHPIGTGPFRFVEWKPGERIVFERNDAYWGRKAWLDRLTFRIVPDPVVALQLAERGELDLVTRIVPQTWGELDRLRDRFYRWRYHEAGYTYVGWNEARPMFADKRVRRAMTLLIDRPGIIGGLMGGLPLPTACEFYWKGPDCPANVRPLPYDPAAGRRLLAEAGWKDSDGDGLLDKDGAPFRFSLLVPATSVELERIATKVKDDLSRSGIDLEVRKVEWAALLGRLRDHDFDACALAWSGGPRTDPAQIWHSDAVKDGSNWVGFRSAKADALIDEAKTTLDDTKRHALYHHLVRLLHDEQPYTWLYVRPRLELVSRRIHGLRPSLMYWQWEDGWVEDAAPAPER